MCGLQTSNAITARQRLRVEKRGPLGLDQKVEFPTLPWPRQWSGGGRGPLSKTRSPGAAPQLPTLPSKEDPETGDGCPSHLRPESGVKQAEIH